MTEMVERVAVALAEAYGAPTDAFYWRDLARAGIAAMREPTEAMLNAARDWSIAKNGIGVGNDQATGCFQAMIAAALAGAPTARPSLSTGSTQL